MPSKADKKKIKESEQQRIKKYREFIKENYDWDYDYIFQLLKFKLEMVRKTIVKNNIVVKEYRDQISKEIKGVEDLLQKVINDNYYTELLDEFTKKYGKIEHKLVEIEKSKNYRMETNYSNIPKEKLKKAKKEYHKIHDKAFQMRKKDLKKAFDLMVENIWNWWD